MSKKFSVADIEAPFNENFHYEAIIRIGQVDARTPTIQRTSTPSEPESCRYSQMPQDFITDVPCSPIVLNDPLIMQKGQWVGLLSIDPLTYPGRRELFDVIGRRTPVPYSQVRQPPARRCEC